MLAILIVPLTFLGVAQHLIGFVDLLKPLLCPRVVSVNIWMILLGKPAVCLTYIGLRSTAIEAKYFVVVNECHERSLNCGFRDYGLTNHFICEKVAQ